MAIQNSASAGAAMMMANKVAVIACGCSPATRVARLVKPMPARPPSPVGSGQLSGAGRKARTPVASAVAPNQVRPRKPSRVGMRRRTMAQPQSAGGTSNTGAASPINWNSRSAITAPG